MYNLTEIAEQIQTFEGVEVRLNCPSETRFKMRYDEFFKERLSDEATVSELRLRIDTFLNTQRVKED